MTHNNVDTDSGAIVYSHIDGGRSCDATPRREVLGTFLVRPMTTRRRRLHGEGWNGRSRGGRGRVGVVDELGQWWTGVTDCGLMIDRREEWVDELDGWWTAGRPEGGMVDGLWTVSYAAHGIQV
ncbi:hypothetical protein E2C01_028698 [Portunus trituberculatus]|uniref:Uncharacterized protein n=1 Tax=Portunus trituberculatus TaxID=210409 RepID=A0A5B7EPQ8_PORTR|nr:hypothetical protein [Portunus trituberculatus]